MNLDDLSYFLAIAEAGSLTRASLLLNVSQPALTKAVQRLEATLSVPLFERTSKGLHLTKFGAEFRKGAVQLQRTHSETLAHLGEMQAGDAAVVRVGATPATEPLVTKTFLRLMKLRPALKLCLRIGLSDALSRCLETVEIDIAVTPMPPVLPSGLQSAVIAKESGWIACRQGHNLLQLQRPVGAAELANERWVLPPPAVVARQQIDAFFAAEGVEGPLVQVESNYGSTMSVLDVISSSNLLGYCSSQLRQLAQPFGITALPLKGSPLTRVIGVISRAGSNLSPLTQTFAEEMTAIGRAAAEISPLD
ncbi:DNA-binding transcriptional LysR family regulator [Cupriavidus metallidurans]|uniref:LysR family transcriptional regulator n=1 Tax=Cupriavidus metallidurans TaxID=119219 RepID=UPI000493A100|nr:LysR family transcriptional regulator [Cupriavidus metallidurans]KWW39419.1 HTH-type transcriptional regulator GbpR [Cupriavidus metallidurans]MDE4920634.1 LysR family transcriptional regulator [Cupriavidus metallidurans]